MNITQVVHFFFDITQVMLKRTTSPSQTWNFYQEMMDAYLKSQTSFSLILKTLPRNKQEANGRDNDYKYMSGHMGIMWDESDDYCPTARWTILSSVSKSIQDNYLNTKIYRKISNKTRHRLQLKESGSWI